MQHLLGDLTFQEAYASIYVYAADAICRTERGEY